MSHFLCNTINPKDYYSFLRSRGCLTRSDQELIEAERTTHSKVQVMLDILMKKGSKAFDDLCDAILGNRTQTFIVTELNKCYEKKCQQHLPNKEYCAAPDDDGLPLPRVDVDELIKSSCV